jgi:hypothetical protein
MGSGHLDCHEHLAHCRLGFLTGPEAGLGLAAAFLGLGKPAAAGRTALLELALDPEPAAAALTALRLSHADIDDELEASLASPSDVTLHGALLALAVGHNTNALVKTSSDDRRRTKSTRLSPQMNH